MFCGVSLCLEIYSFVYIYSAIEIETLKHCLIKIKSDIFILSWSFDNWTFEHGKKLLFYLHYWHRLASFRAISTQTPKKLTTTCFPLHNWALIMAWETKESARGLRKLANETQASKYCFQPPQGTLRSSLSRRRVFGALYLRNIWQVLASLAS